MCYNISMGAFLTDIANISFILGIMGIYSGLSMYKWINPGWKIISAPLATIGVLAISYSIAVFTDETMGVISIILFGGIVCLALFRIGQENL